MSNLVILAGGKSSRMGRDKVFLKIGEETFLERLYRNAAEQFDRIIISTDSTRHEQEIQQLPLFSGCAEDGPVIVKDLYQGIGPMGGMLSVFACTDVQRFSIISVDVPYADMRVLAALQQICTRKAVFLRLGEHNIEPLIAAYDRSAEPLFRAAVAQGIYKLRQALGKDDVEIVNADRLAELFPDLADTDYDKTFRNFNTMEDLAGITG